VDWHELFVEIFIELQADDHQAQAWNEGPAHQDSESVQHEDEDDWCLDEV